VVDNEAGMEHLSRRSTNNVDFLLIVMNPTLPSARAAGRILALSNELPVAIGRRMLLVNRLGPQGMPEEVSSEISGLHIERLPDVPQDDELEREGNTGQDIFRLSAHSPALLAVCNVVKELSSAAAVADKH
jgi:CO dehydrogenase maturation factor